MRPDPSRLFDLLDRQLADFPQEVCIATKEGDKWISYSTAEVIETAEKLALGLMALGIRPGDKVAIASGNRSEWCITDQAITRMGAISVPIYPTSSAEDYAYVLNHSGSKVFFAGSEEIHAKAEAAAAQVPGLKHLFTFDRLDGLPHWSMLLNKGEEHRAQLELNKAAIKGSELATIIYTSGTTGKPKGVMLSHHNIMSNVEGSAERLPVSVGTRCISFLPLCHIYERMLMYLYHHVGMNVHFKADFEDLGAAIREVRPHVFTAVPRLLEKIFDTILAKGEALTGIKRKLFFWSIGLGERYDVHGTSAWYRLQLAIANKLVFSKWREALGGEVLCVASGSAALNPRLARIYNAAGVPVMEGYGLTETSPVVSVNDARNDGLRFKSVGKLLRDVQVLIAEDGEILVKGPNVMMGYYEQPEITAEVMDAEGWFHTGDIGKLDAEGFLYITDRKKEMFKTSGGKYVAPQVIENKLRASRFIEQAMVIGENRKFPAALIVPSFAFLQDYCKLKEIPFTSNEQVVKDQRIIDRVMQEVDTANQGLGHWEQVKKIALLDKDWSIDGGEFTPSMKLRRKPVLAKYADAVEGIYAGT
ncbi:MAG: long-chain fatty acid--CoA ligase [Flavobacteriales bacterium]|nr:long-chain fatty acid--CoA ligase [Flavobacteriales bacterium]MBK6892744.1 long-chain fatty acid--CoA ligase [Flavobacteriales bacterium]MBK7246877.1 long-chain fatty acid--CoA ligase [Flavobacteriales bacterium]MBK7287250.1 long-chain fatty acid--CoA ligase [Flavobacteriales bacterium]MBK9061469.1 long-chain fatty acid--CoA ligase [Flavobacteriales bacterium]